MKIFNQQCKDCKYLFEILSKKANFCPECGSPQLILISSHEHECRDSSIEETKIVHDMGQ